MSSPTPAAISNEIPAKTISTLDTPSSPIIKKSENSMILTPATEAHTFKKNPYHPAGIEDTLFGKLSLCKNKFVVGLMTSRFNAFLTTEAFKKLGIDSEVLMSAFTKKDLKLTTLFVNGKENVVHFIIAFKNDELALKYGVDHNIPYAIHLFFEDETLIKMVCFPPMTASFGDGSKPVRMFVAKVKLSIGEVLTFIGTPKTGLDEAYLTDKPREFDPREPFFKMLADRLPEDATERFYYLNNYMSDKPYVTVRILV